jgi:2-dehydro-3-deoxy-D-arabinonate dehydratase
METLPMDASRLETLCRFTCGGDHAPARIGAVVGDRVVDLSSAGIVVLADILDAESPASAARAARERTDKEHPLADVRLLAPVERQEVWAAGVTYLRSKTARMEESDFSATAYDRVYEAARPEIFFKALGEKAVGTGDAVGIRADARWNVPEPELALVLDARGRHVGCTIGNDMSSRDIEGENLLYLPQAKVYDRSCGLGPWIVLETDEQAIRRWTIGVAIARKGETVFSGETRIDQIKRTFADLIGHLRRSQTFPHGAVLLTGTGVVPDESFTLAAGDRVTITVSGIGRLENDVVVV